MKRHRGRKPATPTTGVATTAGEPVDDGELMMVVARNSALNGVPWDIPAVVVTFFLVRVVGPLLRAPRRIVGAAAGRIRSGGGVSRNR